MLASLPDLIAELDRLLEPRRFRDYCPNGIQVPGAEQVSKIATGVSASVELFERAIEQQAQLLIVHHGIFWGSKPTSIDMPLKRRLKLLFDADMSLAAYHLPLDAHPDLGNNAQIAKALGAESAQAFAHHEGEPIGVLSTFPGEGLPSDELMQRVGVLTNREPLAFQSGPPLVRKLAIVSGAGASYLPEAAAVGADAFLTGEPAERVMSEALELGIHFVAAGHYATETLGVQRLGEHLSERFGVEHVFIDIPNPI